ncbi:uncharacterized, partial [Tachysurus ichikawai]
KHGPPENKEGGGPFRAMRPAIMDWRHECEEGHGAKVGDVQYKIDSLQVLLDL